MTPEAVKREIIPFQNNNRALAFFPSAKNKAEDLVATLDLQACQGVILVLGGTDPPEERLLPQLTQLLGRGLVRAAREAGAVILDKGTRTGVMALVGEGIAAYGSPSALIGVAPKSKISYSDNPAAGMPLEPNHSHFVLTEGAEWGCETPMLFNLVRALTGGAGKAGTAGPLPALALLAGGGPQTRAEVLRAIRLNLPLIVIEGSGGLADEIAAASRRQDKLTQDPVMAEIMADGEIHLHPLHHPVKGIERLIARQLGVDKVLRQAWETFADYDLNATHQQRRFDQLQQAILLVGVAGTALALFQQVNAPPAAVSGSWQPGAWTWWDLGYFALPLPGGWWLLHHLLILLPILLLVLVAAANRFKQDTKWLVLRAGAEAIKREIYLYRTRARHYRGQAEGQLSLRLADITRRTMLTEVHSSSLKPYNKDRGFPPLRYAAQDQDDGFSYLTPDRYVEWRLSDQLGFFKRKTGQLEKQLKWLYWLTYIIGGLGAYLAATNHQVWIALTTSLVAAMGAFLAYRQTEHTLLRYNQAVTDLANIKVWWHALSAEEQAQQQHIDSLIGHTESVLQAATEGGVPQLQDLLADLRPEPAALGAVEPLHPAASAGPGAKKIPAWPKDKPAAAFGLHPGTPYPARAAADTLPVAVSPPETAQTAGPPADAAGNGMNGIYQQEGAVHPSGTSPLSSVQGHENGQA